MVASLLLLGTPAAALEWPSLATPPQEGGHAQDVAVIVSVERSDELPAVPGAGTNAADWYAWFTRGLGLSPSRVAWLKDRDATVEAMEEELSRAAAAASPSGRLWFVFVGHGATAPDGADGVLIGADARATPKSLAHRSLALRRALQLVEAGRQQRAVLIVDACFSGRSPDGGALAPGLQPVVALRAAPQSGRSAVLTAAAADQFAGPLPGARRPAFSYLVLGALRGWGDANGDGAVTSREAVEYARDALTALERTRSQTPGASGAGLDEPLARGAAKGPDLAALRLALEPPASATIAPPLPRAAPSSPAAAQALQFVTRNAEEQFSVRVESQGRRLDCGQVNTVSPCTLAGLPLGPARVDVSTGQQTGRLELSVLERPRQVRLDSGWTWRRPVKLGVLGLGITSLLLGAFAAPFCGEPTPTQRSSCQLTAGFWFGAAGLASLGVALFAMNGWLGDYVSILPEAAEP